MSHKVQNYWKMCMIWMILRIASMISMNSINSCNLLWDRAEWLKISLKFSQNQKPNIFRDYRLSMISSAISWSATIWKKHWLHSKNNGINMCRIANIKGKKFLMHTSRIKCLKIDMNILQNNLIMPWLCQIKLKQLMINCLNNGISIKCIINVCRKTRRNC